MVSFAPDHMIEDGLVSRLVRLIDDGKEQVKTREERRRNADVCSEALATIISPETGVAGRQDARTRIQCRLQMDKP